MPATVTKKRTPARTVADMLPSDACGEAKEWARGYTNVAKAWSECQRGDWMLWLSGKHSGPPESDGRKKLVRATCACARLALPYAKGDAARKCIETAERWAKGNASIEELQEARRAAAADSAYAAYYAADYAAAAAADSAYAADYAADYAAAAAAAAANYAAAAAAAAYYAADYAAAAAAAAAYYAARTKAHAKCADEVRKIYPKPPKARAK